MMEQHSWLMAAEIHCPIVVSPLFPRKTILQTQSGTVVQGTSPGENAQLIRLMREPWASA